MDREQGGERMSRPKENLVRALAEAPELVRSEGASMPVLRGHFAVWDQWTEINSRYEGNFLERFTPTSMAKTLSETRSQIKCLFQHGKDPQIGDKPLGPFTRLEPDKYGAVYEVPLLDTSYNRDLIPGLEAGLYGASFRFEVMQAREESYPKKSDYNPRGLPERTILEARVREAGPVTFPAYANATAGLRSMTDRFLVGHFLDDEETLAQIVEEERAARRREPSFTISFNGFEGFTSSNSSTTVIGSLISASDDDAERSGIEPEPPEATTPAADNEPELARATTRPEPGAVRAIRFENDEEWQKWISRI